MSTRVAANLVVGGDGSTTLNGSSRGLSFPADRQRFHALRGEFAALLIGGNTARNEPYAKTPLPLIVLTHGALPLAVANNPLAQAWNLSLKEAIPLATQTFGNLLLEAGPSLLRQGLAEGLITELFLTISEVLGGENRQDFSGFLGQMDEISREVRPGGLFLHYRLAPSHS